jgi:hypothetical protein
MVEFFIRVIRGENGRDLSGSSRSFAVETQLGLIRLVAGGRRGRRCAPRGLWIR